MAGAMTDMTITPVVCRPHVAPVSLAPSPYVFAGGPEQLTV
jgi:hypothetical protein